MSTVTHPFDHYKIPPDLVVESFSRSLISSRREDLQIEEPVCCGYSSAFHFHATLAGVLGSALLRDEVVQVCEPPEKRLLAPAWMMESFHRD